LFSAHFQLSKVSTTKGKRTLNYLDDLLNVGKTKSLGYLPLSTITDICKSSVKELIEYADKNNLEWVLFSKWSCSIHSGALYLYDRAKLSAILEKNQSALTKANVPTNSVFQYIQHISRVEININTYPEAWAAIHETFTTI